ncbi:hypothetical protein AHAS_Ahas05G0210400 [Arachis hypogaea]
MWWEPDSCLQAPVRFMEILFSTLRRRLIGATLIPLVSFNSCRFIMPGSSMKTWYQVTRYTRLNAQTS